MADNCPQFLSYPKMDVGVGQVGQGFGQTGTFSSHLSRPGLVAMGVRQAGIRLNRLTQMVARLSHPYDGVQIDGDVLPLDPDGCPPVPA